MRAGRTKIPDYKKGERIPMTDYRNYNPRQSALEAARALLCGRDGRN